MHGPEAAKTMRDLGYLNPIIAVTGNVSDKDRKQFLISGANQVLEKPVERQMISKILTDAIAI